MNDVLYLHLFLVDRSFLVLLLGQDLQGVQVVQVHPL